MALDYYCNITTDLTDAYARIEEYAAMRMRLEGFEAYSGSVYKLENSGHVEKLYEDGTELVEVDSLGEVNGAGKWYYDSSEDVLYVWCSDGADPDTHEMERGFDWTALKTRMRNQAQDEIDAMLDKRFPRPIPQSRGYWTTNKYDIPLVRATAFLTCANIVKMFGNYELAERLRKQVTDPETGGGIIDRYNSGELRFSWETSPDEAGHWDLEPDSGNNGDGFIEVRGLYGGLATEEFWEEGEVPLVEEEVWLVEIDKAGAVGTATFKWSRDNGETWEETEQETDYEWISLAAGIKIRFWDRGGEFALGDKWRIYLHPRRSEDMVHPTIYVFRR